MQAIVGGYVALKQSSNAMFWLKPSWKGIINTNTVFIPGYLVCLTETPDKNSSALDALHMGRF